MRYGRFSEFPGKPGWFLHHRSVAELLDALLFPPLFPWPLTLPPWLICRISRCPVPHGSVPVPPGPGCGPYDDCAGALAALHRHRNQVRRLDRGAGGADAVHRRGRRGRAVVGPLAAGNLPGRDAGRDRRAVEHSRRHCVGLDDRLHHPGPAPPRHHGSNCLQGCWGGSMLSSSPRKPASCALPRPAPRRDRRLRTSLAGQGRTRHPAELQGKGPPAAGTQPSGNPGAVNTRRAYADRHLRISRTRDGMSWLSLYGPSPTIEAIWTQCTATAQAAQGPHEDRTLTQLRADIAAALLLCQTLAANNIHAPAPAPPPVPRDPRHQSGDEAPRCRDTAATFTAGQAGYCRRGSGTWFSTRVEHRAGSLPGRGVPGPRPPGPTFTPGKSPPSMTPTTRTRPSGNLTPGTSPTGRYRASHQPHTHNQQQQQRPRHQRPTCRNRCAPGPRAHGPSPAGTTASGTVAAGDGVWPPLPQVTPMLLVPALSLLGFTDEPAWMSGVGPVSIEVAK